MNIVNGILRSGDDASDARFFELEKLPKLAFDHNKIIKELIRGLK
jgi:8-oxo-dGTP diphosphatase